MEAIVGWVNQENLQKLHNDYIYDCGYKTTLLLQDMIGRAVFTMDVRDFMARIPSNSVDVVICDDDYAAEPTRWNPHAKDKNVTKFDWQVKDVPTFMVKPWVYHAYRILKDGGTLVAFGFPRWASFFEAISKHAGFTWRTHRYWFKTNSSPHKRPNAPNYASHTEVMWIVSKGKYRLRMLEPRVMVNWVAETVCIHCLAIYPYYLSQQWDHPEWFKDVPKWEKAESVPEFSGHPWRDSLCPNCGKAHPVYLEDDAVPGIRSVYLEPFTADRGRVHKTKKPEWLIQELLTALSDKGDIVVDPMCGQGTVGVVAQRMGRIPIVNDLDPKWSSFTERALASQGAVSLFQP